MLLYLDTCALNRPLDEQNDNRIIEETDAILQILSEVTKNKNRLAWSFVIDFETDRNPFAYKREWVWGLKKYHCVFQPEDVDVLLRGKTYQGLGLKERDALHVACALKLKCDYLITTDDKVLNKKGAIHGVKIISPKDFIREMEKK